MSDEQKQIISTRQLKPEDGLRFRHPLNPNSDAQFFRLSRPAGLQRSHVNLLRVPPGNRLETLRGDRAGQHSIRINDQWRIVFKWTEAGPEDVEIMDYH